MESTVESRSAKDAWLQHLLLVRREKIPHNEVLLLRFIQVNGEVSQQDFRDTSPMTRAQCSQLFKTLTEKKFIKRSKEVQFGRCQYRFLYVLTDGAKKHLPKLFTDTKSDVPS